MSEFWLISAPGDKENLQALERMNTVTSKSNLSYNTKFAIPDFKVKFPGRTREMMDRVGWEGVFWEAKDKNNRAKAAALTVSLGGSVDKGQSLVRMGLHVTAHISYGTCGLRATGGNGQGERNVGSSVFEKREQHLTHLGSCELLLKMLPVLSSTFKTNNIVPVQAWRASALIVLSLGAGREIQDPSGSDGEEGRRRVKTGWRKEIGQRVSV